MSNYPSSIDDDSTLPAINENITELGGEAINSLRDAVFNIETELGIGLSGSSGNLATRLGIAINPDGTLKSSALTSLGLVTLPITNSQIISNAGIPENKLSLDHKTQDLFNYIQNLSLNAQSALNWISATGSKLDPHLAGVIYRHTLSHILVSDPSAYLINKFSLLRDNTNAFALISDINNDFIYHQLADGSPVGSVSNVTTHNGSIYPSNYGHTASGIFLDTGRFNTIPQTAQDLQLFADFIDSASIFLLGTRIQNLYTNGISKVSRSSSFIQDGYGQPLVPVCPAVAYLLNSGVATSPFDDIDKGDDIIELLPADTSNNVFDEQFALVKTGDIIRINYGTVEVPFLVKERKYIQSGMTKKFIIRINGKNLFYAPNATARIERSLVNANKYGALAVSAVNNSFATTPSLIVASPRSAQTLGVGFDADLLNSSHYLLYLALFTTGNPSDGYTILPGIDVTGNKGATPGKYTLESVVESTNSALRQVGFNYRFAAFAYQGEFGIMLVDSYNNSGFSIISTAVTSAGAFDTAATLTNLPNNVVGMFTIGGISAVDPLGFGPNGSNIASPPYMFSYGSPAAAIQPTKLLVPLKRNNYYISGFERDKLASDIGQVIDSYGDTYWSATVTNINPVPGAFPSGHVEITYHIDLDLSSSKIVAGKTLTIQSLAHGGTLVDFGRFIIKSVVFTGCTPSIGTDITVYDGVHAAGTSPATVLSLNSTVALYFDAGSVSFNKETATDVSLSPSTPAFKRHFEVLVTENGETFTHERARMNISGSDIVVNGMSAYPLYSYSELSKINLVRVSSKLRGYLFGSVSKITLHIVSYNDSTGNYSGYLSNFDGASYYRSGPIVSARKGEVTRFYDETCIDFIDFVFDANVVVSSFSNQNIDIQLLPTLSLDEQVMLIGTCQFNDITNSINYIKDCRQFGNTSEKDLSTSALNFISLPEKLLHENGVIRGFDFDTSPSIIPYGELDLLGGMVLVDGKLISVNNHHVIIPRLKEYYASTDYNINWALCINSKGEYQTIALLDFDAILNTPNDPNRSMQVRNPDNGQLYYIDAATFSHIVNDRKDLTILYIVSITVNTSVIPATVTGNSITDARKYINDIDSNLPLKLTTGNAQGNFKNATSILNWLKFNHTFNSRANLNGATSVNGTVSIPYQFDFLHTVVIEGENNARLILNQPVVLGSNITFKDLRIDFNNLITIVQAAENIIFDHCTINIIVGTEPLNNIILDFIACSNVQFRNCIITVVPYSTGINGSVFRLVGTEKFVFDSNTIFVNYTGSSALTPGQVFVIQGSDGAQITNSEISGRFLQCINNNQSNNVRLQNLIINSTFAPIDSTTYTSDSTVGLSNNITYANTNLVNTGRGLIYSNVQSTIDGLFIDNVKFEYNPYIVGNDRFSFINLELSTNLAVIQNLTITNCVCNSTVSDATLDDIRASISIINTAPVTLPIYQQPRVINADISHNSCNKNQLILMTSVVDVHNNMVYPGLMAQNCNIHDNTCGTIGYWVSGETIYTDMSPTINDLGDKFSSLTIENNTCHLIINLDHTGQYFLLSRLETFISAPDRTVNTCEYPSGNVTITNNRANWIHVGNSYESQSSMSVMNNSLCAYDSAYLSAYNDGYGITGDGIYLSYGYAIFVCSNIYASAPTSATNASPDSACIISNNSINPGYWLTPSFTSATYRYPSGYIFSQGSSIITDNTCKGIDEVLIGGFPVGVGILTGGITNIVKGNKIYRNGKTIFAYVGFGSADIPPWNGANSSGIVTYNFFDSPWITDTIHNDVTEVAVVNIILLGAPSASRWLVEHNINQTGWISVPMTSAQMQLYFGQYQSPFSADFYISQAPGLDASVSGYVVGVYKSLVLHIHEADTVSPSQRLLGWQVDLDKYLPSNAKVIKAQLGFRQFNTTVSVPLSDLYLSLNKYDNALQYLDLDAFTSPYDGSPAPPSLPVGIRDPHILNDSSPPSALLTGAMMNSTPDTQYLTIDVTTAGPSGTDISEQYAVSRAFPMTVTLDIAFQRTSGHALDFYFSPLLVKYRW